MFKSKVYAYIYIYIFLSLDERQWLAPVIIGTCIILTPVWGWVAARNKYTKEVLDTGWTPVVSAMLISRLVDTSCICNVDQQVSGHLLYL